MAEGALDADRRDLATLVEPAGDADHRVELQQRQRGRRIVEIDLAPLEQLAQPARERVEVDLEPDAERHRRADTRTDAAVLRAGNCLVEVQLAAPEVLVAEGVEPEDLLSLLDELLRIGLDDLVEAPAHRIPRVGRVDPNGLHQHEQAERKAEAHGSFHARCVDAPEKGHLRHFDPPGLWRCERPDGSPGTFRPLATPSPEEEGRRAAAHGNRRVRRACADR